MKLQHWEEFSRSPRFKAYSDVPIGFEIVIGNYRSNPFEIASRFGLSREEAGVALWNSTGMPLEEEWDEEIRKINDLQGRLGELDSNVRAVRSYIASYDIFHYQYQKSLNVILDAIASCKYRHELPAGWFITWWPPNQQRRIERIDAYIEFLKAWEQKEKSLTIRTSKQFKQEVLRNIYAYLGEWSNRKRNYVRLIIEKLESFVQTFHYPELYYTQMELSRYLLLLKNKMDQLITPIEQETRVGRNEDKLLQRIENYKQPLGYYRFFTEIDCWLEWIGKNKPIDFSEEERRDDKEILELKTGYFHAITNYLSQTVNQTVNLEVGSKKALEFQNNLKEKIKEPSRVQLWLLTSLWKSLKEQLNIYSKRAGYELNSDLEPKWLLKI